MTRTQKRWAVGGSVGALAIALGYGILHRPHAKARELRGHEEHGHEEHKHKKHEHENARGEYGREKSKHKHHHEAAVGQRPQHVTFRREGAAEEGPGAPIWRLNSRIDSFVFEFGNRMSADAKFWTKLRPVWEGEVLPFLGEWEEFWRDSTRWSWSEFDRWATRWNALSMRLAEMLPRKEHERGEH